MKKNLRNSTKTDLIKFLDTLSLTSQYKSLDELLKKSSINKDVALTTLHFLEFFNVLKIRNYKDELQVKLLSDGAKFFIKSLGIYVENDLSLISDWERIEQESGNADDDIFTLGMQFLQKMEQKRVYRLNSQKVLDEVEIVLLLVKARVKDSHEPKYLFQYNLNTQRFQLLGGYRKPSDKSIENTVQRLISKELPMQQLSFKKNFSIGEKFRDIISMEISSRKGVYTKYVIKLIPVLLDIPNLKLSPTDFWVGLDEMKNRKSVEGIPVLSPLYDVEDEIEIIEYLSHLEFSLEKEQPTPKRSQIVLKPVATEILGETISELDLYLSKEESPTLEFKSSLRWDYMLNKPNKALEKVVAKTIAAFLNTEGGVLLVGVDDEKQILGISNDIQTLPKKNEDGYMQYIISLVTSHFGIENHSYVHINFEQKASKTVCVIRVDKAPHPVFVKDNNDREFFIRAGNTSRPLNPEETYKYINIHW